MITEPHKLGPSDIRDDFRSGADELDDWLKKYARQNQSANSATTYVVTDDCRIVGYYAIAMSAVEQSSAPVSLRKSMPYQIPCILLARLAVDQEYAGQGVGAALLRDALVRGVHLSKSIGATALLVHCRDESARAFYLHNADFLQSPVDELHLMLPIKGLAALLHLDTD